MIKATLLELSKKTKNIYKIKQNKGSVPIILEPMSIKFPCLKKQKQKMEIYTEKEKSLEINII